MTAVLAALLLWLLLAVAVAGVLALVVPRAHRRSARWLVEEPEGAPATVLGQEQADERQVGQRLVG